MTQPLWHRERLELDDGDFLDLDWLVSGRDRCVILSHGLEGNSRRVYMNGMAHAANRAGWDVLSWNYRGCSGEPNRLLRSYHSGATDDLDRIVQRARADFGIVALVGFSLGGNLTLKYLGEQGEDAPVVGAATFSVPCDLAGSSRALAEPAALPYMIRFMRSLREKVRTKHAMFPEEIDVDGLDRMRTFQEFDDRYTAPIHGFRDAEDYWAQCSSRSFISSIRRPALLASALDDPFLSASCIPRELARESEWVRLETPRHGGHVGFVTDHAESWSEQVAMEFLGGLL
ncbi:MAG: alpha/beta fold hydrolase [Rhodothermales bacterium]|nr:alpha/beta fold hydrolase [Rhodothermales bacterium]